MTRLCSACGREITVELTEFDGIGAVADLGGLDRDPHDGHGYVKARTQAVVVLSCGCDHVDVTLDGRISAWSHDVPDGWAADDAAPRDAVEGGDGP